VLLFARGRLVRGRRGLDPRGKRDEGRLVVQAGKFRAPGRPGSGRRGFRWRRGGGGGLRGPGGGGERGGVGGGARGGRPGDAGRRRQSWFLEQEGSRGERKDRRETRPRDRATRPEHPSQESCPAAVSGRRLAKDLRTPKEEAAEEEERAGDDGQRRDEDP